jgi:hypothetical protein
MEISLVPILGFFLYQAPKDFSPTITLNEPPEQWFLSSLSETKMSNGRE